MQDLKHSTSTLIQFGPFVDKTDGVTLKTDATTITDIDHATTGIFISKVGASGVIRQQAVTPSTVGAYGMMTVTLDATDTNTVGMLDVLFANAATYLPVHKSFMVRPSGVYDSLSGTDNLQVDVTQIAGAAVSTSTAQLGVNAVNIGGVVPSSATIGTVTTTTTATNLTNAASNGDFTSSMKASISAAVPTSGNIEDAVWNATKVNHVGATTFGLYLDAQVSTIGGGSLTASGIVESIKEMIIDGAVTFEKATKIRLAKDAGTVVITGSTIEYYDQSDNLILTDPVTSTASMRVVV